jgi:hypothetical protein
MKSGNSWAAKSAFMLRRVGRGADDVIHVVTAAAAATCMSPPHQASLQ